MSEKSRLRDTGGSSCEARCFVTFRITEDYSTAHFLMPPGPIARTVNYDGVKNSLLRPRLSSDFAVIDALIVLEIGSAET